MTPLVYLPETRDDIDEAFATYETRAAGLGKKFLDSLARTVGFIGSNPQLYGEVAPGIRAALTKRFPFVVYYRIDPTAVVVVAVRPGREDPAVWQGRV